MIGRLRGQVVERGASSVIIDVQGVGYVVTVPRRGSFPIGEQATLVVYTHVRDDAIQLFGFLSSTERELFELLISVPSVGPTKAIGMLESPPEDIVAAILRKDLARLSKLPGVGKRTAERLVLDLHDKVGALSVELGATPSKRPAPATSTQREDLASALVNLGFRPALAEAAAERALERAPSAGFDALLRDALAQLTSRAV